MSALAAGTTWHEMEYDERCRRAWALAHKGLTREQVAFEMGCLQPLHLSRLARAEGIVFRELRSVSWPSKESPGWSGASLDTVREQNWRRQAEGARQTRLENEARDRIIHLLMFQAVIPTNNTDPILANGTLKFALEDASELARGRDVTTQELSTQ